MLTQFSGGQRIRGLFVRHTKLESSPPVRGLSHRRCALHTLDDRTLFADRCHNVRGLFHTSVTGRLSASDDGLACGVDMRESGTVYRISNDLNDLRL